MSQDIRRELISKNLGIKPINHGQIYTFQIALPDARKPSILLEQRQAIEKSLLAHQSNLISLIVRRTEAYDDEDIEYELVYGADWLQIAQELDIEKVWAWVFDMTDEQAIATIAEMQALTATPNNSGADQTPSVSQESGDLAAMVDQKLQLATDSIKHAIAPLLTGIRTELEEKLKVLDYKLERLSSSSSQVSGLDDVLAQLATIQEKLASGSFGRRSARVVFDGEKVDLMEASDQAIADVLRQVGTQARQIDGAIAAIHHWKRSPLGLTWETLAQSVRAKTGSADKIPGFGEGTYGRLQQVGVLAGDRES